MSLTYANDASPAPSSNPASSEGVAAAATAETPDKVDANNQEADPSAQDANGAPEDKTTADDISKDDGANTDTTVAKEGDGIDSASTVSVPSPSPSATVPQTTSTPSPASIDVASLEREAQQLSQHDVETLLSFLSEYYTIDLVRLGSTNSRNEGEQSDADPTKDDATIQQQQQIVSDILKVEGCAQCLATHTYDEDEQAKLDEVDKSAEAAATSRAAHDAFILLGCKLLHCRHVVHVLCVLKLQAKLRVAAAAGAVSKMVLPTLDLCHTTSFFRVIAFPIGTPGSLLPSLPSTQSSPHHPSHTYYLELASTHHVSNAQNLHLTWTSAPVHSYMDLKTGSEFIMLLANHPESQSADLPRPIDSSVNASGAANVTPSSFASFFLTRGKFHFTCIQQTEKGVGHGAQITQHWTHTCNYDLSTTNATTPHMKLVLVDAASKNILTIGVQKIHPTTNGAAQLAIAYIKYELAPAIQTPPLSPPLSLGQVQPINSAVSVLASGMSFMDSSAAAAAAAASTGHLPAHLLPGGVDRHGVATSATSTSGMRPPFDNTETIVRDPRDPPTMRLGGGPVSSNNDPLAALTASSSAGTTATGAPIDPRETARSGLMQQNYQQFERYERDQQQRADRTHRERERERERRNDFFNSSTTNSNPGASSSSSASASATSANNEGAGDWDLAMLDAALDRQLAERRNKPDPFSERGTGNTSAASGQGGQWDRRRGSEDRSGSTSGMGGGSGGVEPHDNDALFLPALPSFPTHILNQPGVANQPVLNLTLDQVRGNIIRLAKSHSGSRFVQSKLEVRDPAFFALFYEEMKDHVAELMIDNFGHFAIEKLIAGCDAEQALTLLQRLAPSINIVACQKHGSFSVQALVDTLHTPAQIYTLVEAMKPDILRIITHASGHFVVLRMLQRFPYQSTKFIDECLIQHCATIGTDHHGLRVVKAVLAVRRSTELTRLFKQVARLTMKLVENQYGNYVIQSVLDVAPPGVRTNIKVKMEGKYMRLSKQKFSSNVVERCLKQSSTHWRTIIIRELIAQPAVSELLRDRYGNYVLQTALAVANAQQVQEILRSITPYLPSLRDNVRSKWKKMLRKAGSLAAAGQAGTGFTTGLGGDSPQPTSPATPSSPVSRAESPFNEPSSLGLGGNPNQHMLASVFINPNQHHHAHHAHHNNSLAAHQQHTLHQNALAAQQAAHQLHHQGQQHPPFGAPHHGPAGAGGQAAGGGQSAFSPTGSSVGGDSYASDRSGFGASNWTTANNSFNSAATAFMQSPLSNYNSSSYAGQQSFGGGGGTGFSLNSGSLGSSLAAQLGANPYGVGVAGLNALSGGVGAGVGVGVGMGGSNAMANNNALAGLNYAGFGSNYAAAAGVNNAFGALGGGLGSAQNSNQPSANNGANTLNAAAGGIYDPNLRMF